MNRDPSSDNLLYRRRLYVKVKWEEKRPTMLFQLKVPSTKDKAVKDFRRLVNEIIVRQGIQSLDQRQLVCIDDEGDEVSECVIVIGRVSVIVFL